MEKIPKKDSLNLVEEILDTDTPVMDRNIAMGRRAFAGKQTRLSTSVWLAHVFELNEIRASRKEWDKVLHDKQIIANYQKEFGGKPKAGKLQPGGALLSGKHTIGYHRKRYRRAEIYRGQLRPILMSFKYSAEKHIMRDGKGTNFLTFEQCKVECLKFKIADPRFFKPSEIGDIRAHARRKGEILSWAIPSKQQYIELDSAVAGGIYGCVRCYEEWCDDETPEDWTPPTNC